MSIIIVLYTVSNVFFSALVRLVRVSENKRSSHQILTMDLLTQEADPNRIHNLSVVMCENRECYSAMYLLGFYRTVTKTVCWVEHDDAIVTRFQIVSSN